MRILHVASFRSDLSEPNGAANSSMRLAWNQAKLSRDVVAELLNVNDWTLFRCEDSSNFMQCRLQTRNDIIKYIKLADVVHFNAVYPFRFILVARECRRASVKYIISPRGNLMRTSMKKGYVKKKLGERLFYKKFIICSDHLHFLTSEEAQNSKSFGKPFSIISNSVDVPAKFSKPLLEPLVFGFLGRLDIYHKGLDLLIKGVASISSLLRERKAKVVIAGSDHRGGYNYLKAKIAKLGVKDLISLEGPVYRMEKDSFFSKITVFVHPSRYEGQPLSILESIARGRPCLVTPGTNMVNQIKQNNLGWVAQPNSSSIAEVLRDILQSPERINFLSKQCRFYAEKYFNVKDEAKAMLEMYNVVLLQKD